MAAKCYACNRRLGPNPYIAKTLGGQFVFVGSECFKLIRAARGAGYQSPTGGQRLYRIPRGMTQEELAAIHIIAKQSAKSQDKL